MDFNVANNWLSVQSYKHDGQIHRVWDKNYLVLDNEDFFVVVNKKTKVVEYNGRRWWTKEPSVTFYSKKEWWNTIAMIKKDGIHFYSNIASPSILDHGVIKYIDYDLDIKLFANGNVKLLDEKEYAYHIEKYGYSQDLHTVLVDQTKRLLVKMKKGEDPFNETCVKKYYDIFLAETKH